MSDLVTQAKEALTSTLTKVDDALTAAAPTSAETEDVPDPITGASTRSTPARKPSSASEEKIAALYDHRKEHKDELLDRGVLKGLSPRRRPRVQRPPVGSEAGGLIPTRTPPSDDKIAPALQAKQEALKRAQLGVSLTGLHAQCLIGFARRALTTLPNAPHRTRRTLSSRSSRAGLRPRSSSGEAS
jgi:hypothetical protein